MDNLKEIIKQCIDEEKDKLHNDVAGGVLMIFGMMALYTFMKWLFS